MIYKINDQYEIDSQDITKLTFKLTKVVKNNRSGVAFFSKIGDIKSYVSRMNPELLNDRLKLLIDTDAEFQKVKNDFLKVKHDVSFYFDDFYSVEFDRDTYVLYVHPNLNGGDAPNKDRKKVVCYPSNINSAIEYYYNQILRDCSLSDDAFLEKIKSLIVELNKKVQEIVALTSAKVA